MTIMYCSQCGASINEKAKFCSSCGEKVALQTIDISIGTESIEAPEQAYEETAIGKPDMLTVWLYSKFGQPKKKKAKTKTKTPSKGRKSRWTTFFLCLFAGWFGAHKFYVGRNIAGIIYMCTFGLCGIGWIYDCIVLVCFGGTDKNGRKLM